MKDNNYDSSVHDATLNYMGQKNIAAEEREIDPDYDFKEFGGAEVEEAEDRIYSEYKRRQVTGNVVDEETINRLAGNIPLTDMDQSIIISAVNGHFSVGNNLNLKKDTSLLDLSVLDKMPERNRSSRMQQIMEATAQSQKGKTG